MLLQEGITLKDIGQSPPIISLPLLEVIRYCRLFLKEVKGSTIVVIAATFLIAGFLFVVDLAFSNFFSWIDVLQK